MQRHNQLSPARGMRNPGSTASGTGKTQPGRDPRELHRLLAEHTPAAVAMVDTNLRYLCASRRWLEINNLQPHEIIGKSIHDSLPHLRPLWGHYCLHCLTTGESACRDLDPLPFPNGLGRWIKWEIRPWRDRRGVINGLVLLIEPRTRRKEEEEKLLLAKKRAATQLLASGIAHDFNNLLAVIAGNIELAQVQLPPHGDPYKMLNRATAAVSRACELTRKFITISASTPPCKKISALEELIQEAAEEALAGSRLTCAFDFKQPLPQLPLDRGEMRQLFLHLLTNSKEAMGGEGIIRVSGEVPAAGGNNSPAATPMEAGGEIKITVADEGAGIAPQDLEKIFDPYYSTRERGSKKGRGLGLTIVQAIIHHHNGLIGVESKPGQGTTVTIHLPLTEMKSPVRPRTMSGKFPGLRILVMDDEEAIRTLAQKMLELMGCEVEVAGCGEEAVRLYTEAQLHARPFQAVILDLTVKEGMGGKEALGQLLPADPQIRAILSSGYTMDPAILELGAHGFKSALLKPYTMAELYQAVAAATAS